MGTNFSKKDLTEEDLEMLQKQSQKPKEEILFWYEHFIKECPSGKMDQPKFVEYYTLFNKEQKNIDLIAERCFEAFDTDKNGFVDFREFLLAYAATSGSSDQREKLKYVFDICKLKLSTLFRLFETNCYSFFSR